MYKGNNLRESFENWWDSLSDPWSAPEAKSAAWEAWKFSNLRVLNKIRYMKGITERCNGYNEAMNEINNVIGENP